MSTTTDPPDPKRSRKEIARELRRAAYQRAKEQRASDPRFLSMKAAIRERQREIRRAVKERRKNDPKQVALKLAMKQRHRDANRAAKDSRKAADNERAERKRSAADEALKFMLKPATRD